MVPLSQVPLFDWIPAQSVTPHYGQPRSIPSLVQFFKILLYDITFKCDHNVISHLNVISQLVSVFCLP